MSEQGKKRTAYLVPILLIGGGLVILILTMLPKGAPVSNPPAVTQRGGDMGVPTAQQTSEALPQEVPSAQVRTNEANGKLPAPLLTPYDEAESVYQGYTLLVPGQPVTYSISAHNDSGAAAYNLVITDHLPISLTNPTCIASAGSVCTVADGQAIYRFSTPVMNTAWNTSSPMPANIWVNAGLRGVLATLVPNGAQVGDRVEMSYSDKAGTPQPTIVVTTTDPAFVPPNLPLTMSAVSGAAQRGQIITYTISFTNAGSEPLGGVWLQGRLSDGLQYYSCETGPMGGYSHVCDYNFDPNYIYSNTVTFFNSNGGAYQPINLGPGESRRVTMSARVKLDAANGTPLTATVELHAPVVVARASASNVVQLPDEPHILLNSNEYSMGGGMVSYGEAYPRQPIKVRVPYRNIGGAAAYGLRLTDQLPAGFEGSACDGGAGNNCTIEAGQVVYSITNPYPYPSGASAVITLTMRPTLSATRGITLSNSVVADYRDVGGNAYHEQATLDRYVVVTPTTMTISQSDAQETVQPGQIITYTIIVTNTGPLQTDSFYVADFLPPGMTYVGCAFAPEVKMGVGCSKVEGDQLVAEPHVQLSLNDEGPNLNAGRSMSMTVRARVDCNVQSGTTLTNRVLLFYNGNFDGLPAEDSDTVQGAAEGCQK